MSLIILENICECCGKLGIFNHINEKFGQRCKEHKTPKMEDTYFFNKCNNCNIKPIYNFKDEKIPMFCEEHKKDTMIKLEYFRCIFCDQKALFNYKSEKYPICCFDHKEKNMLRCLKEQCQEYNCEKVPIFNIKGESRGKYCFEHKKTDMIDIRHKICIYHGCDKRAGYKDEHGKILYCKEHSNKNIKRPDNRTCKICGKRAVFNMIGEKKGKYCKQHKTEEMVDVVNIKCLHKDCKIQPVYNYPNENKGKYCSLHALDGMVDVRHDQCEICKNIRANFGFVGEKQTRCFEHKLENMILNSYRICVGNEDEDCKDIATFGIFEPFHCEFHSNENEICLLTKECKNCNRKELLNKDGLCITYCEPDERYKKEKKEKVKEKIVLEFLDKNLKLCNIIEIKDDKIVNKFCNYYRPDRVYDFGTHYVIVEIDEYQHKGIRSSCAKGEIGELSRMHEIQNAAGIHCIFLRFNPDCYKVNSKIIDTAMNNRLEILLEYIKICSKMIPNNYLSPCKYKYLFYDQFSKNNTTFLEIDDLKLL